MSDRVFSDIKVIDLTHYVAGPYCTKLFAGFGAEVIKIERPGCGDRIRSAGPFLNTGRGLETSIPFLWLNTGKKSVTLNLKSSEGVEIFKRMVRDADVVVENFSPRVMPGLGLGYDTLREINPRLVMASISNFGQTGPYRDYKIDEIEAQAMCGMTHMTGDPEREPLASGPSACQYSAGMHAYTAILLGILRRETTGLGGYADISIMECGLEHVELTLTNFLQTGKNGRRSGHILAPWDIYPCRDGYAAVISAPARNWLKGAEVFKEPGLYDDKFSTAVGRSRNRKEIEALIRPWLSVTGKKEVFMDGQERKLGFGYVAGLDEALSSPQHRSRGFFTEIDHPVAGRHEYCSAPYKLSRTPWQDLRAPLLGEHNSEIYGRLGFEQRNIERLREGGVI